MTTIELSTGDKQPIRDLTEAIKSLTDLIDKSLGQVVSEIYDLSTTVCEK